MEVKQFQKDEVIFRQGEEGNVFYQVIEGTVGIYINYDGSEDIKLTERTKDQFFGEMAVIDAAPRSAGAVALQDGTTVNEISVSELNSFFEDNPQNIVLLMKALSERLRSLTAEYTDAKLFAEKLGAGDASQDEAARQALKKYSYFRKLRKEDNPSAEILREEKRSHSEGFAKNVTTYPKGTVICMEGDLVPCMYDIHWGRVGIFSQYGKPGQVQLSTLAANDFFGEMGMVDEAPRSATAVALDDDTTIETIYPEDLKELFQKNPLKVDMILKDLSSKLRSLTAQYYTVCEKIAAMNSKA